MHVQGHRRERLLQASQLVAPPERHVPRVVPGCDRFGGLGQPHQRRGDAPAQQPGPEESDEEEDGRDQRQLPQEYPGRGQDFIPREFHHDRPRSARDRARGDEHRPDPRPLVAQQAVRLPHVDGRSRHRPGEVGPDIARHVAHVEGALGADQPVGLVARLRRGVDPAPLRQVSQEPAPFDDGHRDGEQHRVARGPEAPDGAGIRSGGRPYHRGVDQLACARTVQDHIEQPPSVGIPEAHFRDLFRLGGDALQGRRRALLGARPGRLEERADGRVAGHRPRIRHELLGVVLEEAGELIGDTADSLAGGRDRGPPHPAVGGPGVGGGDDEHEAADQEGVLALDGQPRP